MHRCRLAFALVDLLVLMAAVAVLLVVLAPLPGATRRLAGQQTSANNLRTLGAAHYVYAIDWNGRQLTYVVDDASTYGGSGFWASNYEQENGQAHPPIRLGWGQEPDGTYREFAYLTTLNHANASLVFPINFGSISEYFGSFRLPNAQQFHQYVGGRYYDETFYAPADEVVIETVGDRFDDPAEYVPQPVCPSFGRIPVWSSYCLSPAAMLNPEVLRHDDPKDPDANGYVNPWDLADGFASPSYFSATYAALKTHVLEHHWLQNAPVDPCNPGFVTSCYVDECEPYYFNMGRASAPTTLFYDGHVDAVSVEQAMADDAVVRSKMGPNWGLWSADTPWGEDGYVSSYGYDDAVTSFHILTTDGIEGRDILGGSAATRGPPPAAKPGAGRPARKPRPAPPGPTKISYDP